MSRRSPVRLAWPTGLLLVGIATSSPALADSYDDVPTNPEPEELPDDSGASKPATGNERPLGSGGLTAPGALPEKTDDRSQTERELEEADRQDARRGLEFAWLNGEFGYQYLDVYDVGASGLAYGGGVGLRVLYFTLGARFRMADLDSYDVWSLVGEGTMRFPFGHFEPYALLGFGYAQIESFPTSGAVTFPNSGADLRLAVGADYYLSDTFSLGAQVGGDFLFLPDAPAGTARSSLGKGLSTTLLVGLHF